jgi:GNAT superfamily N-acetyltransferase
VRGTSTAEVEALIHQVYSPVGRLSLGLLRLVRGPIFDFWVIEEDGTIVGSTLLAYGSVSGIISAVAVRPAYRRRGFARALLARAHRAIRRAGRRYAVLEVLSDNTPATTLYRELGYTSFGSGALLLRPGEPVGRAPAAGPAGLRRFHRRDTRPLLAIYSALQTPGERALLPAGPGLFSVPPLVARVLEAETEAWVLDRGAGPTAFLRATSSGPGRPGHLSQPIVARSVSSEDVEALVAQGVQWLGERGADRVVLHQPSDRPVARLALERNGFTEAWRFELQSLDLGP